MPSRTPTKIALLIALVISLPISLLALTSCSGESESSHELAPRSSEQDGLQDRPAASQAIETVRESSQLPAATLPHSSRLALDWAGTYSGVLPCGGCPDNRVEITLHDDGRFRRTIQSVETGAMPVTDGGTFTWNEAGSIVTLNSGEGEPRSYQVGEHRLFQLSEQGQPIDGELANSPMLHQHIGDRAIENRRWRLTELEGRAVVSNDLQTEPFLVLDPEASRVYGNGSCNSFSGGYAIKPGQRISFGPNMRMTLMACPHMDLEQRFMEVLGTADNYSIGDDAAMTLNRARMAPLARFVEDGDAGREIE